MMFVCSVGENKAISANESKNAGGFDCCLLVGEKSSQGPKNRVNLICFQNSCSASVSCNQQRSMPQLVSLHPFCLTQRKGKLKMPQTWQESLETCKDSLWLCLSQK